MTERVGLVLGGRYRLVTPIGRGASAQVFLADDLVLRRRVAVKLLHVALATDEVFLRRFRAEAQSAAALNHPHIMAVHDWGNDDEPYLVMEYLSGGSLRGMLDPGVLLSPAQTVQVGIDAARGLAYAHRRGFIHRDIKPANLLFDDEARLRIADFGLARALAEAAWTEPAGAVLGTARYASPEQAQGLTLDGRSDVYSLALVLVEAATGRVPFTADTPLGTLMARVDQPLPVDPWLGALAEPLQAAGAPDPADRPDAATFVELLGEAAARLERPEPLPLAGTGVRGPAVDPDADPTVVGSPETRSALDDPTPLARPTRADRRRARRRARDAARAEREAEARRAAAAEPSDRVIRRETPASTELAGPLVLHSAEPSEAVSSVGPVSLFDQDASGGPALFDQDASDHGRKTRSGAPTSASTTKGGPRRRRVSRLLAALAVCAAVIAGVTAWQTQTAVPEVPTVVGGSVDDAEARLAREGWEVIVSEERAPDTVAGEVLAQTPAPGTGLAAGEAVRLRVSLGPPLVEVPADLAGLSLEEATARMAAQELTLAVAREDWHEEVPAGAVIGLGDGVDGEVEQGSEVPVVVSIGPAPRVVPDLAGKTLAEATADLEAMGLAVEGAEDWSERVPAGQVMQVRPAPGEWIARGEAVTVIVSKGPELIAVPRVAGMTPAAAADAIEAEGLCVSGTNGPPNREVQGTVPSSGTEVRPGSCVTLVTG